MELVEAICDRGTIINREKLAAVDSVGSSERSR